jgi:hypothetical protein
MPSDNRERSFENALAAHLRADANVNPHPECTDAETLAAYHEGSLPAQQIVSLKTHIAACERCQQILTTLEATEEIPAPAPLNVSSPAAAAAKPPVHVLPRRKITLWQWIAPAGALAAALLVWVAVRESTPTIIPAKAPIPAAKQEASEYATQAQSPKPEPQASRSAESPSLNSTLSTQPSSKPPSSDTLPVLHAAPRPTIAGLAKERGPIFPKQKDSPNAAKKSDLPADVDPFGDSNESSAADLNAKNETGLIASDKAEIKEKVANGRRDALSPKLVEPASPERASTATPALSAPPPTLPRAQVSAESAEASGGTVQQQQMAGISRFKQSAELRLANALSEVTISAPDGHVSWRVGQAGIIQFSPDAGKSWSVQPSGVVTDLLAGSAPSDKICWMVGRAGTVLLTTDAGAHWQKLRPPVQEDLRSIFAVDARQAIVSTPNAKFQTTDGGITWKKLPPE